MKKLLAIIAAMLAIINVAYAYDFESGGIYYNITSDNTVAVTSGDNSYSGDISIPETVTYSDTEYTVTKIADSVFMWGITNIVIPATVTSIGSWAFEYCSSLVSITSLNPVPPTIGENTFNECPIEAVFVPTDAIEAYQAADGWKEFYITDIVNKEAELVTNFTVDGVNYDVISIKDKKVEVASGDYSGDIIIPETVTYSDFEYSVTSIGDSAFENCASLTSIKLPSSVTSIGNGAFFYCESLTSIELPSSLTSIGNGAFFCCSSLSKIELPSSLISIDGQAFKYCYLLTNIEFPQSLTSIGYDAFAFCSSLTSIELPSSLTEFGGGAFAFCGSLQEISISEANENYTSVDGVLYNKNLSKIMCYPGGKPSEFIVPSSVTSIGDGAFEGTSLTSIELPASLISIESDAFGDCRSLASIELPSSLTSIGAHAFAWCTSLASIELPSSVTSIGFGTFQDCTSLRTVTSLNPEPPTLNEGVFHDCPILAIYVPIDAIESYQAADVWKDFYIADVANKDLATEFEVDGICYYVTSIPNQTVKVAKREGNYSGDIVIPETVSYSDTEYTVTSIGGWAFSDCTSLTSIELPSSLTSIGDYAFAWCYSLRTVTCLNPEPPTLGSYVFNSCPIEAVYVPAEAIDAYQAADGWKKYNIQDVATTDIPSNFEVDGIYYNITSEDDKTVEVTSGDTKYSGDVVIPETVMYSDAEYTVTAIGSDAFNYCWALKSIELPASVTTIGAYAFNYCWALKSIELPASVTTIGEEAFFNSSLESIELPASLTSIGRAAFYSCSSLTSIELPSSLTSIAEYTFFDCRSLTSIELPASVTTIGENAFSGCFSLQEISVSEANENYTSIDGVLYDKNVTTLMCCPGGKTGEFTVPASVTEIGKLAFRGCASLTSIELPASVTAIGDWAFYECSSLKSIGLSASLIEIGNLAFRGCASLTSIELPASLTKIGHYAFGGCKSLTSIELPQSVTSIGNGAFSGCSSLKTITSLNPEPPTLGSDVFESCPIETVYVPAEAVEAYQSAEGWSEFNIVGMSNVGDEAVPVYVVSDIVEEEGTVQEAREEVSFNFVEYSEVATGQGTATLTREGSSEVVNLPAAQIAGEATQARALRVVAADGKDYQVVQPLGNAATDAGNYTIHFPEGYFLLGTQKENSPAFTMSFTVGDVSGITDAIINSADAEYYTLQGVKVQGKPAPGIYICRQGNKATKVVVK